MKRHVRKKVLSAFLTAVLLAGSCPSAVFADSDLRIMEEALEEEEISETVEEIVSESGPVSEGSGEEMPEENGTGQEGIEAPGNSLLEEMLEKSEETAGAESEEYSGESTGEEPEISGTILEEVLESHVLEESPPMYSEEDTLEEASELYEAATLSVDDLIPTGTVLSSVSGWTGIAENKTFSDGYLPVRFYKNISGASTWVDDEAKGLVKVWNGVSDSYSGYRFMYPTSADAKGKFGVLYTKVIYDGTDWYDMKMTVADYTTSVMTAKGERINNFYPAIGFHSSSLRFESSQTLGGIRVKVQFFKSGTNTPASLNTRFQWWDIDTRQRFGLQMISGTIDNKYYFKNDTPAVYSNVENILGVVDMEMLTGGVEDLEENESTAKVIYEISDCKAYNFVLGPEDHMSETSHGREYYMSCQKALNSCSEIMEYNGEEKTIINDMLLQTDVSALIKTPEPVKQVSNDGTAWGDTNTLGSTTGEYYYRITQRLPWQDADYRYSAFVLTDTLPKGVDYVSLTGIRDEGNLDKKELFTVTAENDVLRITAKKPDDSDFAGHYYTFTFKVRMDPEETEPVYAGNSASYSVLNKASVAYKNKIPNDRDIDGHGTTNNVITAARTTRSTQEAPQKGINRNRGTNTYTMQSRTENIIFSIFQKIPAYEPAWEPCRITVTDRLEPCLEYVSASVSLDGGGILSGWAASVNGQTVTVAGTNKSSYGGRTLRFDIICRLRDGYDLASYRSLENGSMIAVIPNTAGVKFAWTNTSDAAVEKQTNTVFVKVRENAVNLVVKKTNEDTGEIVPNAVFTVYEWDEGSYRSIGRMIYDTDSQSYKMNAAASRLVRTGSNAGKFKVAETVTPSGYIGSWSKEFVIEDHSAGVTETLTFQAVNAAPRGIVTICKKNENEEPLEGGTFEIRAKEDIVSPEGKVLIKAGTVVDTVTTGKDGQAVSEGLYMGSYRVSELKAPAGYAAASESQDVTLSYKDKNTVTISRKVTFTDSLATVHLRLTKEINAEDIVWAHGNPAFTFRVDGTDLYGRPHTYFETVEFTPEHTGTGTKAALTADIPVLSGTYRVVEEKTMRYSLKGIHSIVNGKVEQDFSVVFYLTEGADGEATFYNVKTTDASQSHTVFVRNIIEKK